MEKEGVISKDERTLAALAHGSILLGVLTNGVGGMAAALVIWLTQKEKSAFVATQALQALIYQLMITLLTGFAFCCWGLLWMLLMLPAVFADPGAYQAAPPPTLWVGLALLIVPFALWLGTIIYGLIGAVRVYRGDPFAYPIAGKWAGLSQG